MNSYTSLIRKTFQICLITLISATAANAQSSGYEAENFCKDFVNFDGSGKRPTIRDSMKLFRTLFIQVYRPHKMVDVHLLNQFPGDKQKSEGEKAIFVLLPNPVLTAEEEAKIRETIDLWKQVKKLDLVRKMQLKSNLDQATCVQMTNERPDDFKIIQAFHASESANSKLISRKMDATAYAGVDESLKKYTKDGWKIIKTGHYAEVYRILQSRPAITEIMFILHSITDGSKGVQENTGMLYDSNLNVLPRDFFISMPSNIRKILLMSCHSNEIIQHYRIAEASDHYDFYYSVPTPRFEASLKGSFPQNARYAFKKASRSATTVRPIALRNCRLEIESLHSDAAAFVELFAINQSNSADQPAVRKKFVGVLSDKTTSIPLNCSDIPSTNVKVVVSYLGSPGTQKTSLQIQSMRLISASGTSTPLNVSESFKISNPNEHYETVGRAPVLNRESR
jgi:hypothetical protein